MFQELPEGAHVVTENDVMNSPILAILAEEDRRELIAASRRRKFTPQEVVFHEGDPGDTMHIVLRGHLMVRITTPLGDVAAVRVLRPGEFFGELAVISVGPRNATVVAMDRVETLAISRATLEGLEARCPGVAEVITEALAQEIRRLAAALSEALYLPAETRVARRVLDLSVDLGTDTEPTDVVRVTQVELAQLAGRDARDGESRVAPTGRIQCRGACTWDGDDPRSSGPRRGTLVSGWSRDVLGPTTRALPQNVRPNSMAP